MAQERIQFGNNQASGFDSLGGASPIVMNIVTEVGTGAIRRRPGITAYTSAVIDSQGITGLYETVDGTLFAVGGTVPQRSIYLIANGSALSLSQLPESDLRGSSRPIFAETEAILAIAGGLAPQKVLLPAASPQGSTAYASSRIGGSPPDCSHIVANASRLLANDVISVKGQVTYSYIARGSAYSGFENWTTVDQAGTFQADARPDPVLALAENTNEVFCFGTTSLQVWTQDATNVYAPSVTSAIGCSAPYSVIRVDQNFAVLDHLRRFMLTDGHGTNQIISDAIQRTLNDMGTVSDCFGYRVLTGPLDLLVWTFPTERRTFAYQKGAGWSEWSGFDSGTNNWSLFGATCKTDLLATSQVLLGTSDGKLGTLDFDATADFDGPDINAFAETGFISHGTENRKHCRCVSLTLRRGETTGTDEPSLLLSWRDTIGPWESPIEISMGASADYETTIPIYSLGVYRRRQWRIEFTGPETLLLASVVEEFDILDMEAS